MPASTPRDRLLIALQMADPVSYTHLDVYKRQGRGSDASTRYALDLFRRLGLQLLVVTPCLLYTSRCV